MRNLLATRWGRLTTFFFLYLTEGIPLGFVATAVATQLRRQGVGPAEIGGFIALFYLPWSFKFVVGPIVDSISSDRFGRRRTWILLTQTLMVATLLATILADLPAELKLFSTILFIHNLFAATQDVAIDALAVNTLQEHERGLANGLMFGAAYLGQIVGGSAVLLLMDKGMSLAGGTVFVSAVIASVLLFIVLPMREPKEPKPEGTGGAHAVLRDIWRFMVEAFQSLVLTRRGFLGMLFAILPAGAMSLGLALQSNLAVEIGMTDGGIANMNFWSGVISAAGCVIGGLLSDRLGRRRMLALYIGLMSVPVLYLAWVLQGAGWIFPVDTTDPNRPIAAAAIFTAFWIAVLVYSWFNGLMYGTRTALFMDITNPAVAATQFTAYMALLNLSISLSAKWQGWSIEAFGYPVTLVADAFVGLLGLGILVFLTPFVAPPREEPARL